MITRVLVIDDEENIRRVIRLTLEAAGVEVGEAGDGASGLEQYEDGSSWDAVILDQKMPGMDGLETLSQIKERNADARVIMATAYASIELAVDAMKLGATDFVRKPMTPEIVRNALTAALAKPLVAVKENDANLAPAESPSLIKKITMNGFEIMRPAATRVSHALQPDEHLFIVKSSDGNEQEVIVKIDQAAVGYVERLTRRGLKANGNFWASRAEYLLSGYLWNEGKPPIDGRLVLSEIDRDELMWAERWEGD